MKFLCRQYVMDKHCVINDICLYPNPDFYYNFMWACGNIFNGTIIVCIFWLISAFNKHFYFNLDLLKKTVACSFMCDVLLYYMLPRGRTIINITFFTQTKFSICLLIGSVITHISYYIASHQHNNSLFLINKRKYLFPSLLNNPEQCIKDRFVHRLTATCSVFLILVQTFQHTSMHRLFGYITYAFMINTTITGMVMAQHIKKSEFYNGLTSIYFTIPYLLTKSIVSAYTGNIDAHKFIIVTFVGLPISFSTVAGYITIGYHFVNTLMKKKTNDYPLFIGTILLVFYDILRIIYDYYHICKTDITNPWSFLFVSAIPYAFIFVCFNIKHMKT